MLMGHHNSYHTSNRNPNTMISPNSTSPSIHHSAAGFQFPFGSLDPQQHHHSQPPPPQQQQQQEPKTLDSLRFDGSPYSAQSSMRLGIEQPTKKKRGRPRKYAPDGNIALGLAPTSPLPSASNSDGGKADAAAGAGSCGGDVGGTNANSSGPPAKRNRGRPPGSGKKQFDALRGTGGWVGFTPHVIKVKAREDIASKVMAFSHQGPRAICILSASGAVSNVTLREPAISGGTVTYEMFLPNGLNMLTLAGQYEILSLSGSFIHFETSGSFNRTGSLSVSLAGSNGQILGGEVAGMLVAGSPVQVIAGSFVPDGKKQRSNHSRALNSDQSSAPPTLLFGASATLASPQSRGPSSESSEEQNSGSPLHRSGHHGIYVNSAHPSQSMQMYQLCTGHNPQ